MPMVAPPPVNGHRPKGSAKIASAVWSALNRKESESLAKIARRLAATAKTEFLRMMANAPGNQGKTKR